MSIEYMLVICPDQCPVRADGNGVGFTNHTLLLPSDEYTVTVDTQGCVPESVDVVLSGTSLMRPCVVIFTRAPATLAAPLPAPLPVSKPASVPAPSPVPPPTPAPALAAKSAPVPTPAPKPAAPAVATAKPAVKTASTAPKKA
ncbi:hypothetical protein [Ideonella azotifigens]|uniref:hypothetical protein n=1 Tax=Ideonella azotifigens TaxID=513160 RepID=UPI001143B1ED|nr:hypothetical protein [Ideonella azotifigens]